MSAMLGVCGGVCVSGVMVLVNNQTTAYREYPPPGTVVVVLNRLGPMECILKGVFLSLGAHYSKRCGIYVVSMCVYTGSMRRSWFPV